MPDDAITKLVLETSEDGLKKIYSCAAKKMPAEMLMYLCNHTYLLDDYTDDVLRMLADSSYLPGVVYGMLEKYGDDFYRVYQRYGDDAIEVMSKYGDELFGLPESYRHEAIDLVMSYGDEVLEGIRKYGDDFMIRYANEGETFIQEYLEKGDEVFENATKPDAGSGSEGGKYTTRLNELRDSLPTKYQIVDSYGNKIGNVAYSTSDIEGYQIGELKSFSKYGNVGQNGIKNPVDGWVSSVENPVYSDSVLMVNSDNQIDLINGYLRNNDTEYKIIENYNQMLNGNYNVNGKITIVSEREICPSCDNVIKAFSKDYRNIEIILIDGAGKGYIVKNGLVQ